MSKLLILIVIVFLLHSLTGQVRAEGLTSSQKITIEKQVDAVFKSMLLTAENLNYDQLAQGVDDTYKAGFIVSGNYFSRFDSLIVFMKSKAQGLAKQQLQVQNCKITVLAGNIALLTANGVAKVEVSQGNSFSVNFFWTFVFEKIGNEWKVVHSHQSNTR